MFNPNRYYKLKYKSSPHNYITMKIFIYNIKKYNACSICCVYLYLMNNMAGCWVLVCGRSTLYLTTRSGAFSSDCNQLPHTQFPNHFSSCCNCYILFVSAISVLCRHNGASQQNKPSPPKRKCIASKGGVQDVERKRLNNLCIHL